MLILGFIGAFFIGFVLGLMGGGGSILAVPVLVYLLDIPPVLATAYSLFIVGTAAAFGAFNNYTKGLVDVKTAVVFAIPSFIGVYLTRLFIVPTIPQEIFTIGNFTLTKELGLMLFFALIMALAAFFMIRGRSNKLGEDQGERVFNYPLILLDGLVVGVLTGIVGAGGGFLIVPALVLLAKIPMKMAVGTSLTIVAVKSLFGFIGDIQSGQLIDWGFLASFTGLTVVGIFVGGYVSNYIPGKQLKKGFGWFVLVMAVVILIKELS